jgi:hypothetical protein
MSCEAIGYLGAARMQHVFSCLAEGHSKATASLLAHLVSRGDQASVEQAQAAIAARPDSKIGLLLQTLQELITSGENYGVCFSAKSDYFAETRGLAEPAARFYSKLYLSPFSAHETGEYVRSIFGQLPNHFQCKLLTEWLQTKTLGHPYFLAFICQRLALEHTLFQADRLDSVWPSIFEQLGREKFRSDTAQLSPKEIALLSEFATISEGDLTIHQLGPRFQREYFGRLTDRGLLMRTARGRYRLYHPLFRAFLQQQETETEQLERQPPKSEGG